MIHPPTPKTTGMAAMERARDILSIESRRPPPAGVAFCLAVSAGSPIIRHLVHGIISLPIALKLDFLTPGVPHQVGWNQVHASTRLNAACTETGMIRD